MLILSSSRLTPSSPVVLGVPLNVSSPLEGVRRTGTPEVAAQSYGFLQLTGLVAQRCTSQFDEKLRPRLE